MFITRRYGWMVAIALFAMQSFYAPAFACDGLDAHHTEAAAEHAGHTDTDDTHPTDCEGCICLHGHHLATLHADIAGKLPLPQIGHNLNGYHLTLRHLTHDVPTSPPRTV